MERQLEGDSSSGSDDLHGPDRADTMQSEDTVIDQVMRNQVDPTMNSVFRSLCFYPEEAPVFNIQIGVPLRSRHISYPITVSVTQGQDSSGPFQVVRRFSEFYALKEYWTLRWPGIPVPQIPPKQALVTITQGNNAESVVGYRRLLLESFLIDAAQVPFLRGSDEFTMFIRGPGDFKEACKGLRRFSLVEVAGIYSDLFKEYTRKEITSQTETDLNESRVMIKSMLVSLRQCREVSKNLAGHYSAFQVNYGRLAGSVTSFEESCLPQLSIHPEVPIFRKWVHEARPNPFEVLYSWFTIETTRLQAIIDALDKQAWLKNLRSRMNGKVLKDEVTLRNLKAGKKSFSQIFSGKSMPVKIKALEDQIQQGEADLHALDTLITLISLRLHDFDLIRFKATQTQLYEKTMKRFGELAACEYSEVSLIQMVKVCRDMATINSEAF